MDLTNKITTVTRRDIRTLLINGWNEDMYWETTHHHYLIWGLLNPLEFLSRLYPLDTLPSYDSRYENATIDIHVHTVVNPNDYEADWFWTDDRINISNGSDENLLNFLAEIFHPEVRDDNGDWKGLLTRINNLLDADGFKIKVVGKISKRDVYGWGPAKRILSKITEQEVSCLSNMFNFGGYVLDFPSHNAFNSFTLNAVGDAVSELYNMPMWESLNAYLSNEDEDKVITLLKALWSYANSASCENYLSSADIERGNAIMHRIEITNPVIGKQSSEIKEKFNNDYILKQIDEMVGSVDKDPTNAIGLAKELIESCCKTILRKYNLPTEYDNLSKLVRATTKTLKLTPEDISDDNSEAMALKSILRSLGAITDGLATLRNKYGRGHGKDDNYKGLCSRHANLAVGTSSTLVRFIWDCYELRESQRN